MAKLWLLLAGLSGLLSVVFGAFGAHGLKGKIADNLMQAFQTGTHYQMFHTLALFGLGVLMLTISNAPKAFDIAGYLWLSGVILFSGSLYFLALGGPSWLGPVTPIGGMLLIFGWCSFLVGAVKI